MTAAAGDGGRAVRVLIAPDKFKGSLTAVQAADAIAAGVLDVYPDAGVSVVAVADGGEGTLEAALASGATQHTAVVAGPDGAEVTAAWALRGSQAVIETARASGLSLVAPTPATALGASSFGSGQLILYALDAGATEIVVGLGGSAMTDGGSGAMRALGLRILDRNGHDVAAGGGPLREAAVIDASGIDPRLSGVSLRLAVDVTNPLHGSHGAAHVFAAQKGADAPTRAILDASLSVWADLLRASTGVDVQRAGSGAAGGFPAAFLALANATIEPGFDLVAELVGLDDALTGADLVITGEGSLDVQSLGGKAPIGVARSASRRGIPVLAVAGRIELTPEQLAREGIVDSASIAETAPSAEAGFADAALYLREATRRVVGRFRPDGTWRRA